MKREREGGERGHVMATEKDEGNSTWRGIFPFIFAVRTTFPSRRRRLVSRQFEAVSEADGGPRTVWKVRERARGTDGRPLKGGEEEEIPYSRSASPEDISFSPLALLPSLPRLKKVSRCLSPFWNATFSPARVYDRNLRGINVLFSRADFPGRKGAISQCEVNDTFYKAITPPQKAFLNKRKRDFDRLLFPSLCANQVLVSGLFSVRHFSELGV